MGTVEKQCTPGPWKVYDADSDTMHVGTISADPKAGWKYETICHLYADVADNYDTDNEFQLFPEAQANALLIASAPELLEALMAFSEYVRNAQMSTDGTVQYSAATITQLAFRARSAIAKAMGI